LFLYCYFLVRYCGAIPPYGRIKQKSCEPKTPRRFHVALPHSPFKPYSQAVPFPPNLSLSLFILRFYPYNIMQVTTSLLIYSVLSCSGVYCRLSIPATCALNPTQPPKRSAFPCPYYGGGAPHELLVKDEYIVLFHDYYSLEEHNNFVGYNLSERAEKFSYMRALNAYSLKISEDILHKLIRYNPGMEFVEHNRILNAKLEW